MKITNMITGCTHSISNAFYIMDIKLYIIINIKLLVTEKILGRKFE